MTTYSETRVLTYEQVLDELRAIVAEKGADYVYPKVDVYFSSYHVNRNQCVYFDPKDGTPSCIVGHWLARHDVYLGCEEDGLLCELNLETDIRSLLDDNDWVLPFTVDASARTLLMKVQYAQDVSIPWGTALDEAIAVVEGRADDVSDPWAGE